jgi:hypothetical protein
MSEGYTFTRDGVQLRTGHNAVVTAYAPVHRRDTTEFWPANFMGHDLPKDQAELLAHTVAPHLFPEEGEEPWRKPIREIYKELQETIQSYTRDWQAFKFSEVPWSADQVADSLSGLLRALQGTQDKLEELL